MAEDLTPLPGAEGLMRALGRQKAQQRRHEAREDEYRRKSVIDEMDRAAFLEHCQPATLLEYTAWMIGFLQRGGEPSHVYDYEFGNGGVVLNGNLGPGSSGLTASSAPWEWWVLSEVPDEDVPSLYGAKSLKVIVPSGLRFGPRNLPNTFHGCCGHSTFYFMDGHTEVGGHTPVYTDMLPVLAAGL